MKINLFPTFKLLFQVHLIALCMCVIATLFTLTLWAVDFADKQLLLDLVCWTIAILLCTIVWGILAYLSFDASYKMPNEEEEVKPEAYDEMTGENIQ